MMSPIERKEELRPLYERFDSKKKDGGETTSIPPNSYHTTSSTSLNDNLLTNISIFAPSTQHDDVNNQIVLSPSIKDENEALKLFNQNLLSRIGKDAQKSQSNLWFIQ